MHRTSPRLLPSFSRGPCGRPNPAQPCALTLPTTLACPTAQPGEAANEEEASRLPTKDLSHYNGGVTFEPRQRSSATTLAPCTGSPVPVLLAKWRAVSECIWPISKLRSWRRAGFCAPATRLGLAGNLAATCCRPNLQGRHALSAAPYTAPSTAPPAPYCTSPPSLFEIAAGAYQAEGVREQ